MTHKNSTVRQAIDREVTETYFAHLTSAPRYLLAIVAILILGVASCPDMSIGVAAKGTCLSLLLGNFGWVSQFQMESFSVLHMFFLIFF